MVQGWISTAFASYLRHLSYPTSDAFLNFLTRGIPAETEISNVDH